MCTKPRTASRWRVSASLLQYRCSTWQTCAGGCCTCHLSYTLGGEPQTLRHSSPSCSSSSSPSFFFFFANKDSMSVVVHQPQQFVVLFKLLLILLHQPQTVCGSFYIVARCALSLGSPTLQGLLHVLPEHALPWGLACNVIPFFSGFLLSSNSRPPSLCCSLAAPLRRRLSARAAASKPSLRAAASSRSRTGSMPARRECGSTGLLCLSCLRLPGLLPGLLRCLPQRGSPQAPQVAQVARRLQICSSPCHACLSCSLRYLRLAPLPSAVRVLRDNLFLVPCPLNFRLGLPLPLLRCRLQSGVHPSNTQACIHTCIPAAHFNPFLFTAFFLPVLQSCSLTPQAFLACRLRLCRPRKAEEPSLRGSPSTRPCSSLVD